MAEGKSPAEPKVEFQRREGRRWPVVLLYLIGAFIIASIVVFGGRWIHHKISGSDTKVKTPQIADNTPSKPTLAANKKQPVTTPPTVPDTGPGSIALVFAAATLAGAALHYIITLRKSRLA